MGKAKTNEEFAKELKEKRPDLEQLSFYVNAKTKVKVRGKECGHVWEVMPNSLLILKTGCPYCAWENLRTPLEKMLKRLKEVHGDSIIYISGFEKMSKKCFFKCTICGYIWKAVPCSIIHNKTGCPVCALEKRTLKRTTPLEKIIKIVDIISNHTIEYVSGYTTTCKKCKWRCKTCGYEWETTPNSIINNKTGCKKCKIKQSAKARTTPLEKVIECVKEIHGDSIVYVKGYVNSSTKCTWKCNYCGLEWEATPGHILSGRGCPICAKYSMERPIIELLKRKGIKFLHDAGLEGSNYNGSSRPLRADFIIETIKGKLVIETDGIQHFKCCDKHGGNAELQCIQARDIHKNKYCKENGICLIRITSSPTKEWGFPNHIVMKKFFELLDESTDGDGNLNIDVFRSYDFNRE